MGIINAWFVLSKLDNEIEKKFKRDFKIIGNSLRYFCQLK